MSKVGLVFDTNTLISAILIWGSLPDIALTEAIHSGTLLFSDDTFAELQQVITRQKFDKYVSIATRIEFIAKLRDISEHVEISESINACRDVKGNKFLEVAVNGKANVIITGDRDLLILHPFRKVDILPPAQFLTWR